MLEIDQRIDQDTKGTKAAILEERLKIQEEINLKLVARIKLLEYALQQMSSKRNSGRPDLAEVPSAYNDNLGIRREKSHKSNIMQFLEELGYEDIFNSQEAKEIKTMFSKNPQNMSKNEAMLDAIHKFDADYDDEIKENLDEAQSQNGSNGEEQKEEQVSDDREMAIRTKDFMRFRDHDTYSLKGHLDTVRDGAFVPHLDQAITVSEDCTIRLWDLGNIDKESYKNYDNFEHNYFSDGSEFAGDSSSFYSY